MNVTKSLFTCASYGRTALAFVAASALGCTPVDGVGVAQMAPKTGHVRTDARVTREETLRRREVDACAGVPAVERTAGPLSGRDRIVAIRELRLTEWSGKIAVVRLVGAQFELRPAPGLTRAWLTHVARCHVLAAEDAVATADVGDDPLWVGTPDVVARELEDGFALDVVATDGRAREIVRRGRALLVARRAL